MCKWKKDFEKTKREFNKVDNLIESFKYKHSNINHLYEWIMGIALALFFSVSLGDLINNSSKIIVILGYVLYPASLLVLFVSILLYIILNKRQRKILSNLYRIKDKNRNIKLK